MTAALALTDDAGAARAAIQPQEGAPALEPAAQPAPPKDETKRADDLGKRLIRRALDEPEEDIMATLMRLMSESSRRLEQDFDPGQDTQRVQDRIMEELDDAIKEAAARRQPIPQSQPSASSDKRRRAGDQKPPPCPKGSQAKGTGDDPNKEAQPNPGESPEAGVTGGALRESRRAWGHLPQRDREEVMQGAGEGYVERYRAMIERYYRALQEAGE